MPHAIYGPPDHSLETIRFSLRLPTRRNGRVTVLEVQGDSSTKRGPLWVYRATWSESETTASLEPADQLHWLALTASQDRPWSQEAFNRAITPSGYEDVPLPY